MVDWKKILWNVPNDFKELQDRVKRLNLLFYIMLVALVFIYFGTLQMDKEINTCWDELSVYRSRELGGFPEATCYSADGYVLCDLDNFTLIDYDNLSVTS